MKNLLVLLSCLLCIVSFAQPEPVEVKLSLQTKYVTWQSSKIHYDNDGNIHRSVAVAPLYSKIIKTDSLHYIVEIRIGKRIKRNYYHISDFACQSELSNEGDVVFLAKTNKKSTYFTIHQEKGTGVIKHFGILYDNTTSKADVYFRHDVRLLEN